MINERDIRADFPIFDPVGPNAGLVYLDSGASAQKPRAVIEATSQFYSQGYANIHRGVYKLSQHATDAYEAGRHQVRRLLNAREDAEIIFVRGATEGLNLVAQSWGRAFLQAGDRVIISELEHHANIVPWQILRDSIGIDLAIAPILDDGGLDRDAFSRLLSPQVKLVAITHIANGTGAVNPVAELIAETRSRCPDAKVLIDGCQAVPHRKVDVQALDCDFYVFSGHKIYGPTGIGALYGKAEILRSMPVWQTGGDMILSVTFEATDYQDIPHKFEAGTPDIAGVVGLTAALSYIEELGWDWITAHEADLVDYGTRLLTHLPGVSLLGAGPERSGIFSFTVDGIHPHDLGTIFDQHNVAIRAGNHCAQPLMARLGVYATARASLGIYNDRGDLDALADAITSAQRMFRR